jgi:hypothetical protein
VRVHIAYNIAYYFLIASIDLYLKKTHFVEIINRTGLLEVRSNINDMGPVINLRYYSRGVFQAIVSAFKRLNK